MWLVEFMSSYFWCRFKSLNLNHLLIKARAWFSWPSSSEPENVQALLWKAKVDSPSPLSWIAWTIHDACWSFFSGSRLRWLPWAPRELIGATMCKNSSFPLVCTVKAFVRTWVRVAMHWASSRSSPRVAGMFRSSTSSYGFVIMLPSPCGRFYWLDWFMDRVFSIMIDWECSIYFRKRCPIFALKK